jgi:hypothetical protein
VPVTTAHWPKANKARTRCQLCWEPIRKHGNGWVHTKRSGPGRPRTKPWRPADYRRFVEEWHEWEMIVHQARRRQRFLLRKIAGTGALVWQIADSLGLSAATVTKYLDQMDQWRRFTTVSGRRLKSIEEPKSPLDLLP